MRISRSLWLCLIAIIFTFFVVDKAAAASWEKTYGENTYLFDYGRSVQQTSDGGYVFVGRSGGVIYLVKTDADGNEIWSNTFGGSYAAWGHSVQQTTDGGYILVGTIVGPPATRGDVYLIKTDPDGNEQWSKTFGGSKNEWGNSVQQTTDGGYIIVGGTEYWIDEVLYDDVYLIKTDRNGNEQWNKILGRSDNDVGYSVRQTTDGGYIIAGMSNVEGSYDVYLLKTDSDGNELWDKTFGGSASDIGREVQQAEDGGYVIAGQTDSFGAGKGDVYLIKTDSDGNEQWSKTFGGSGYDNGQSVQQTGDGGYVVAGESDSFGADHWDVYLIKVDPDGNEQWSKTFGGSSLERGYSLGLTRDGGYIIVGETQSFGADTSGAGTSNAYLIKTDSDGNEQWSKTFGRFIPNNEFGSSVQQTTDGGYIIVGTYREVHFSGSAVYLIKTDTNGNELWNKTFADEDDCWGRSVQQTRDGGYIIAGGCFFSRYGSVYLVKTDAGGNEQWSNTFVVGDEGHSGATSVQQTTDGGYIVAGWALMFSGDDALLLKTDADGNEEWRKTFDGSGEDDGNSVQQTSDGGYIIVGSSVSYNGSGEDSDAFLIKTDRNGNEQWRKIFFDADDDIAHGYSVQQTTDDGYIIAGYDHFKDTNYWVPYLLKTDSNGNRDWYEFYWEGCGQWCDNGFYDVQQTTDGGYIATGYAENIEEFSSEALLLKTDANGKTQWSETFGGNGTDSGRSVQQTIDGGYVLVGSTEFLGTGNIDVYLVYHNPSIIDNGDAGTTSIGRWTKSPGETPFGEDALHSRDATASYTFEAALDGPYRVSMWWISLYNRCASIQVDISDDLGLIDTVYVNQKERWADNGSLWNDLDTYNFSGTARVTIYSVGDCTTCADAVRFIADESCDLRTYYRDRDADGYGNPGITRQACSQLPGYVDNALDCDDSDPNEHPNQTWYKDADNDGYSDSVVNTTSCTRPPGFKVAAELTSISGDCDDSDQNRNPGVEEVCNGQDDDCDGKTDEGCIVNEPPEADAGSNQTVVEGKTVTLDGSKSSDPDGDTISYQWTQIGGTLVTLSDPTAAKPTFVTPVVSPGGMILTFVLAVKDNGGLQDSDEVSVTVNDNGISGFPDDVLTMICSTGKHIGVKVQSELVSITAVDPDTIPDSEDKPDNLPYGLFDLLIKTEAVGGTAKVTFYLESPAGNDDKWYKYIASTGVWEDCSPYAVFNAARDQVTLTLVDGGDGDDGPADGWVVDPSGLNASSETSTSSGGGGGGGGGCFIDTATDG